MTSTGLRASLAAALLCMVGSACTDETGPPPILELDGPAIRRRPKGREIATRRSSKTSLDLGDVVGDSALEPLSTADHAAGDRARWPEEVFAVGLGADQLYVLRRFVEGVVSDDELDGIFYSQAAIAPLEIATGEARPSALGVEERSWSPGATELSGAREWAKSVHAWREGLGRLRWARFLPSRVEVSHPANGATDRLSEGSVARVEIEWLVSVELADGGLRFDRGTWISEWGPGDTRHDRSSETSVGWLCRSLRPLEGTTYVSTGPAFVDITHESLGGTPLDPLLPHGGTEFNRALALHDVNEDGHLDLVVSLPNRLLLGDGTGRFEDVSEQAGIVVEGSYYGVLAADFDRDGDVDLVFAGKRRNTLLYEQVAPLEFEPRPIVVSSSQNIPSSLTAHDVDGDGWLDLMICGYGPFLSPGPERALGAANGRQNQMLRGGPDGFSDVTEAWGLLDESSRWTFIGAFGDADGDGDDDLYVVNDFGQNVLYRRVQDSPPRFAPEVEDVEKIAPGFSMSATWADLDGDLDLDLYVSNMEAVDQRRQALMPGISRGERDDAYLHDIMSRGNTVLFQEERGGERVLVEAADERGARDAEWAWGTALFDWDLDGDLDIQCVNGFMTEGVDDARDWDTVWWRRVLAEMHNEQGSWPKNFREYELSARQGWSWAAFQHSVFYDNDGSGNFTELASVLGLDQDNSGRGIAMGDIDHDGDPDLVGTSATSPHVYVLRNDAQTDGHFAWVELVPAGHRSAAGAEIRVTAGGRTYRRDVALGEGYLTQHEMARHFGLVDAQRIERLEVTWPDGAETMLSDLPVDRRIRLVQGEEGWTDVPLKARNHSATAKLGPVEWAVDRHQIQPISDSILEQVLGEAMRPSPFAGIGGDGSDVEGEADRDVTTVVVLTDPTGLEPPDLSMLGELADLEHLRLVVAVGGSRELPELSAELTWHCANYKKEALGRLARALSRWCGTHAIDWPVAVYTRLGRVEGISRGTIVPERVRAFCGDHRR